MRPEPSRRSPLRSAGLGLVLACTSVLTSAADAGPPTVRIDNFSFVPDSITVHAGTAVTWENRDDIPHSVVLSDKTFRSKPLDTGDTARFTFAKPGEFSYFCGLHPHMQGKVIVVP